MTRRGFLTLSAASAVALTGGRLGAAPTPALPPWKRGELELHFIYTGCGENCFYVLPDGTTVLNDCGELHRHDYAREFPVFPRNGTPGGDVVADHILPYVKNGTLDYLAFSHWHCDHVGHCRYGDPDRKWDYYFRVKPDGSKVNGFLCVADRMKIGQVLLHDFPHPGRYNKWTSVDSAFELMKPWLADRLKRGGAVAAFEPGACNQFALKHDPAGEFAKSFSMRTLAANGAVWDGREGVLDLAAEHWKASTFEKKYNQNAHSAAFVIKYGRFSYYAGGDVGEKFRRASGEWVDIERKIADACGPVTLAKMNHHGCSNVMTKEFVAGVRPKAWVSCMWAMGQCTKQTLDRVFDPALDGGERPLVFPTCFPKKRREEAKAAGYLDRIPVGAPRHVVFKVSLGGEHCTAYLIDPSNARGTVTGTYDIL